MFALLLSTTAFFAAAEDKPKPESGNTPAISLDGNWTVLCAEKDGKPMPEAKNMTVTAKGDTITCSGNDGKAAMTMKVEFGPHATIKVTETTGDGTGDKPTAKKGVYVLTQDYFSLCVHDASDKDEGKPTNKCTVVLTRTGTKPGDR